MYGSGSYGTTDTMQSVASLGSAENVLTSNGTSALLTFQVQIPPQTDLKVAPADNKKQTLSIVNYIFARSVYAR